MLQQVVTFDEKFENLLILVISYKVIMGIKILLIRHYENLDFQILFYIFKNLTPSQNLAKK